MHCVIFSKKTVGKHVYGPSLAVSGEDAALSLQVLRDQNLSEN